MTPNSDTVASTLIYLFYRLALDPSHAKKLRAEALGVDIHNPRALQSLEHLNGCINEILRLHPSVPTGGYRETPPEGVMVVGRYIPGNITVVAPRYTIGRREFSSFSPNLYPSHHPILHGKKSPILKASSAFLLRSAKRFHP